MIFVLLLGLISDKLLFVYSLLVGLEIPPVIRFAGCLCAVDTDLLICGKLIGLIYESVRMVWVAALNALCTFSSGVS